MIARIWRGWTRADDCLEVMKEARPLVGGAATPARNDDVAADSRRSRLYARLRRRFPLRIAAPR